ncbi:MULTISPECIES: hypothetical protein [unclassified Kribbella]|uniref:hypothetical protein n=1 Tax=unclassified Kribbella TaxID=2644121 RepID=UPI0030776BEB
MGGVTDCRAIRLALSSTGQFCMRGEAAMSGEHDADELDAMRRALGQPTDSSAAGAADDAEVLWVLQSSIEDHAMYQALLTFEPEPDHDDRELARQYVLSWRSYSFTPDAVRRWMEAGLGPSDMELAADLEAEGIEPERLDEVIVHPNTREPATILDVAYDWRLYTSSLSKALDQAGVERQKGARPRMRVQMTDRGLRPAGPRRSSE